jgi:hypothetical protein
VRRPALARRAVRGLDNLVDKISITAAREAAGYTVRCLAASRRDMAGRVFLDHPRPHRGVRRPGATDPPPHAGRDASGPGEDLDDAIFDVEVDARLAMRGERDGVCFWRCHGQVELLPVGAVEETEHALGVAAEVLGVDPIPLDGAWKASVSPPASCTNGNEAVPEPSSGVTRHAGSLTCHRNPPVSWICILSNP